MPELTNFPIVTLHQSDPLNLYSTLEWQKVGAKSIMQHYMRLNDTLNELIEHCRYFHIPIGKFWFLLKGGQECSLAMTICIISYRE